MLTPKTNLLSKCHCGSGRKYKNCCWKTEKRTYAIARESIRAVHEKLNEIMSNEDEGILIQVSELYFEELEDDYGNEVVVDFIKKVPEMILQNEFDSALSDFRFPDKTSLIDRFINEHQKTLHPAALEYLVNYRDASYSLYEITKVVRGSHFEVTDLLSRKKLTITEKSATESLTKWDIYFFRFVPCMGENLMSGFALNIPRMQLDYVMEELRENKYLYDKSKTWAKYLKTDWSLGPQLWADIYGAPKQMPIVFNTDNEKIRPIIIHYTINNNSKRKAMDGLNKISAINIEGNNFFSWVEDRPAGKVNPVLIAKGKFISNNKFQIGVNSEDRCQRVGETVEQTIGHLIIEARVEYQEFNLSEISKTEAPPNKKLDVPKEVMAQVYEQMYSNWPDEHLPALDGKTPREAAKDKTYRKKVVNLLKTIESSHSAAGDEINFLPIWKELGLKRP